MDDLIEIIHQLSPLELSQLKKELKADKQKLKLLEYLLVTDEINNDEIIELLNYTNNKSAYYTFKHRLLQDIIAFKVSMGKTKVIKIKEEIDNLRTLLYSNQPKLLEKKLNDLAKRASEAEIYSGVKEIYLCMYFLHFHDQKRREQIVDKIQEASRDEELFSRLEFLFFDVIFKSQDQFYAENKKITDELEGILEEMEKINKQLDSKISNFLFESTYLTTKLNTKRSTSSDFLQRIKNIYIEYLNSPLQFYYPNCKFAIQCLMSKYYFNNGWTEDYEKTIGELESSISEIKGFRTYEDVYFYYLHAKANLFLQRQEYKDLHQFLNDEISEVGLGSASNKICFYLLFLKGVGHYYGGNFSKAYSYLLKARNYTKFLEESSRWILIETSVFALMVLSREANYQLIDSEKKYLKRQIKKSNVNDQAVTVFLEVLNAKTKSKKRGKLEELHEQFKRMQKEHSPLKLVDLDYFLKN